jgi:hypothetical protein
LTSGIHTALAAREIRPKASSASVNNGNFVAEQGNCGMMPQFRPANAPAKAADLPLAHC